MLNATGIATYAAGGADVFRTATCQSLTVGRTRLDAPAERIVLTDEGVSAVSARRRPRRSGTRPSDPEVRAYGNTQYQTLTQTVKDYANGQYQFLVGHQDADDRGGFVQRVAVDEQCTRRHHRIALRRYHHRGRGRGQRRRQGVHRQYGDAVSASGLGFGIGAAAAYDARSAPPLRPPFRRARSTPPRLRRRPPWRTVLGPRAPTVKSYAGAGAIYR